MSSGANNSVKFQLIFTNEVSKSKVWFFYPMRYNLLIYLTSELSCAFSNLFTFFGTPFIKGTLG